MSDTLAPTPETDAAAAEFVQTGNATALIARCSLFEISLHAQTARADALESLNATMHERISGLVAEIAQAKEYEATLRQWVTMYRDELEGCAKVVENTDTIGAALLRTRVASLSQLISGGKIPQGEHFVFRPI